MNNFFSTKNITIWSAQHRNIAIFSWLILVIAAGLVTLTYINSAITSDLGFTNEPESIVAAGLIRESGIEIDLDRSEYEVLIIKSQSYSVNDQNFVDFVNDLTADLLKLDGKYYENPISYYSTGFKPLVSEDQKTLLILFDPPEEEDLRPMINVIDGANRDKLFDVTMTGDSTFDHDFQTISKNDLELELKVGIPAALIILILVFGALVSSLIPIVIALISIVVALGITTLIGQVWPFSFFVTNMIAMMGLAVGVDYSLLIVSRYREERNKGLSQIDAISKTGETASKSVIFSGITVVLALIGMLITPFSVLRSLGGGAIVVVVVSVAASLTLLPAMLSFLGDKINAFKVPFIHLSPLNKAANYSTGFWYSFSKFVMRHSVISILFAVSLLLLASIPAMDLKLGQNGITTFPEETMSRRGFEVLANEFSYGFVGSPVVIVLDELDQNSELTSNKDLLVSFINEDDNFGPINQLESDEGEIIVLRADINGDPNSQTMADAVKRIRNEYVPNAFKNSSNNVRVTGLVAFIVDYIDLVNNYLPIVIIFVLTISFFLLAFVFRSIIVPIKAVVMNLLSVGSAYGFVVLVFQKGFAAQTLGFQQVEVIDAWVPVFLFAVLFGLSMDYHVFLLSRIREYYDESGDNENSIALGVKSTSGLITGAAMIMVAVFSVAGAADMVMFQQVGMGLAIAIFLDATIIRSILVPASMKLLGKWNWWFPIKKGKSIKNI
ncbi:MAG: putative drug exporter of the RND superfamily [Chloroflexi bacterium]|nr:MAG: putative drug exporter of the RND superfamily [Chloroflexota bacterium]